MYLVSANAGCDSYRVSGFHSKALQNNGIYKESRRRSCVWKRQKVYSNGNKIYMYYFNSPDKWMISKYMCSTSYDSYLKSDDTYPPLGLWKGKYEITVECGDVDGNIITSSNVIVDLLHPQLYQQDVQDSFSLTIDDNNATCLQLSRSDLQDKPITLSFKSDNKLEGTMSVVGQGLFCYNAQACYPNVVSMKAEDVSLIHFFDTTNTCTLKSSQQDDIFTVCEFMCQCPLGCHHISVTLTIDAIAYTARKLKLCETKLK